MTIQRIYTSDFIVNLISMSPLFPSNEIYEHFQRIYYLQAYCFTQLLGTLFIIVTVHLTLTNCLCTTVSVTIISCGKIPEIDTCIHRIRHSDCNSAYSQQTHNCTRRMSNLVSSSQCIHIYTYIFNDAVNSSDYTALCM